MQSGEFLRAEWRHLAMLNFETDPGILLPRVPAGTELDTYGGRAFVSMVGFLFLNTTVFGVPIPFNRDFEEVNLRFYVRRKAEGEWRRGVVFVKEIVPKFAVAMAARLLYNENYEAMHMGHDIDLEHSGVVEYRWFFAREWNRLMVKTTGEPRAMVPGSPEEFIAEHYWGYVTNRKNETAEYAVEHPPWMVRDVSKATLECNAAELYGPEFEETLQSTPASAFLADGSDVVVREGRLVEPA
jgi:hypothetical protein